ncbi:MAG: hypothetical protein ABR582_17835, partial [Gemmatimonadaceae bacterium]
VPLTVALILFILMTTWQRGRLIVRSLLRDASIPLDVLLNDLGDQNPDKRFKPVRVPGTAVFLTSESKDAPLVLLHHLKHNKVLHEHVVLLSVVSAPVPEVPTTEQAATPKEGEAGAEGGEKGAAAKPGEKAPAAKAGEKPAAADKGEKKEKK